MMVALCPRKKKTLSAVALNWFFIALFTRLVATVIIHFYSLSTGFEGFYPLASGHDDRFYWISAIRIAAGEEVTALPNAYPIYLSLLIKVMGADLLLAKMFNAFFGALSVYYGVLASLMICKRCKYSFRDIRHPANITGLLLSFYPASVFYSTQLLKDPLILLSGTLLIYALLGFSIRGHKYPQALHAIFSFVLLWSLRPYFAIILSLAYWLTMISRRKIDWRIGALIFLAIMFIPYIFGYGIFGLNYIKPMLDVAWLKSFREDVYSKGGSAANIPLDVSNPLNFIASYTYSFFTAFLGPFPWQLRSPIMLVAMLESIITWLLLIRALLGMRSALKNPYRIFIFISSTLLIATIALFSDNIGANTRLRLLPLHLFYIFFATRICQQQRMRFQHVVHTKPQP